MSWEQFIESKRKMFSESRLAAEKRKNNPFFTWEWSLWSGELWQEHLIELHQQMAHREWGEQLAADAHRINANANSAELISDYIPTLNLPNNATAERSTELRRREASQTNLSGGGPKSAVLTPRQVAKYGHGAGG